MKCHRPLLAETKLIYTFLTFIKNALPHVNHAVGIPSFSSLATTLEKCF